jgi:pSer/pThr/pTyr-binding forkhead associated (FHA) protein
MEQYSEDQPILMAQTGPLEGERWTIEDELLIGRDPNCDIVIITHDKQVSRRHAQITINEEEVILSDLNSKNGTHVNSERIYEPVVLNDGDTIQISIAQQFVFLSSDATVPLDTEGLEGKERQQALMLDKRSRRVWIRDKELDPPLSVAQFAMLDLLYQAKGDVVSRHELIATVWGEEQAYEVSNQALDALVRRLRDRLAEIDSQHNFIVTVRGHGLRLENPSN